MSESTATLDPSSAEPAGPASAPVREPIPGRVPAMGLLVGAAIILAAIFVPPLTHWQIHSWAHPDEVVDEIAPLHARWVPIGLGVSGAVAVLLALAAFFWAEQVARRLGWRALLVASYVVSLVWLLALALVRGRIGVAGPLDTSYEYLPTARSTAHVGEFLRTFIAHIPLHSPDNLATHVAGHPPLATLFFIGLDRLGVRDPWRVGIVVCVIAASICVAVLVALRALDCESAARRVAPFLVLTPSAVFLAVSGDAVFAAVSAWGLAALALAARSATSPGRRSWVGLGGYGVVSGLLLGSAVMMSYGLPVLGLPAVAVLIAARTWKPLPISAIAAAAVVLAFVPFGFSWWKAYPVLHDRYWDPDAVAVTRPAAYWSWGDLGDLLLSGGPLLAAGVATLGYLVVRRVRERRAGVAAAAATGGPARRETTVLLLLAGAGALMVAAADASGMSKGEVERIWLPFVPWLTLSLALLPPRWRRWGFALQVLTALLVEQLLSTSW